MSEPKTKTARTSPAKKAAKAVAVVDELDDELEPVAVHEPAL
jgi:hypothetical protein